MQKLDFYSLSLFSPDGRKQKQCKKGKAKKMTHAHRRHLLTDTHILTSIRKCFATPALTLQTAATAVVCLRS